MARRVFTVSAGGITVANQAVTLVFINPAAAPNFGIRIRRCWVNQSANATSAQQRVQLVTQVTAFPTLVSATPQKHFTQDPNASIIAGGTTGAAGTCGINASAEGAGAKTIRVDDAFNVLTGYEWRPTGPDDQIELPAGLASGFGLHLPVAPATLTNWAFGVTFEEY
jgi:hypothetical protein